MQEPGSITDSLTLGAEALFRRRRQGWGWGRIGTGCGGGVGMCVPLADSPDTNLAEYAPRCSWRRLFIMALYSPTRSRRPSTMQVRLGRGLYL
ncbi:hypothetical protein JZ751_017354 [Albula glossodonta]|uniref:Uncharacterized protein n=1 Tax=Albula glossodonta TaxID=121402 RepID=A0A8T2PNS5_9TELE|nr:hypothetical protein JZ751_017354 [Albula glossodonta]